MRLLIACEESAVVRRAFAARGWDAWSCDLTDSREPARSNREGHLVGDVRRYLYEGWDMMIAHPPCTYLSSSGLHWNARGRGFERTEAALDFVARLLLAPIGMICIENPRGCIATKLRPADQWIQPYEFGEDASKNTGLWLKNLPPLRKGRRMAGRVVEWPEGSGQFVERWSNQTDSGQNKLPPSKERARLRSVTYPGIAEAMAEQWTAHFLFNGSQAAFQIA